MSGVGEREHGRGSGESPTPHAQPFYCPYCGEQDIRPAEEHAEYHCRTCDRQWKLEFRRLGARVAE